MVKISKKYHIRRKGTGRGRVRKNPHQLKGFRCETCGKRFSLTHVYPGRNPSPKFKEWCEHNLEVKKSGMGSEICWSCWKYPGVYEKMRKEDVCKPSNSIKWEKHISFKSDSGMLNYEWRGNGFTIDVSIGSEQGHPGSNQVNVFMERYGGWILDTPKNFRTVKEVEIFVAESKQKLERGITGRKVPFPE